MADENRPTVLIVDDERINRVALAELLQDDCRLILAKDGPSALERVASSKINLILLDASMPGMDGYEVLRRLKANDHTSDIGVIFVTGQTDEQDEEKALLLGALDYIVKPIRPLLVLARIRNHLKFARQRELLAQLSLQDGLTGIANRRAFDQAYERACAHASRNGESFGLALIDVDCFKLYNDHYGHGAGDDVLRRVAGTIASFARRPNDLAARYGGEEFALLLSGPCDLAAILETARKTIVDLAIPHERSHAAPFVTISAGGVAADLDMAKSSPGRLLQMADEALYRAKHGGRNCILIMKTDDTMK
ncbi:diguanylate cyclase domain-containing protein [Rhizobium binxianense]